MRFALAALLLLLVAPVALAGELTAEQKARVQRVIGPDFETLPDWRKNEIFRKYAELLRMPEEKRARIQSKGLKKYLIQPRRRFKKETLPEPLHEEIQSLPRELRPLATKLAIMRLRQLRLDHAFAQIPMEKRWPLFKQMFPDRKFDPKQVNQAHRKLRAHVSRAIAEKLRAEHPGIDEMSKERKLAVMRELLVKEDARIVQRIRRELFHFKGRDPRRLRAYLERSGFFMLERLNMVATPRDRELIRYALNPFDCPLLDLSFLGPMPEDRMERRYWVSDYVVLARIELLSQGNFNREMVLHLASTGSPEDFWRAVLQLRGRTGRKPAHKGAQ